MWSNLEWHATKAEVCMDIEVLFQDWLINTWQKFEDMEEVSLVAVASVGELHWKLGGEPHWKHGWWFGSMEMGQLKLVGLERGWNTVVGWLQISHWEG